MSDGVGLHGPRGTLGLRLALAFLAVALAVALAAVGLLAGWPPRPTCRHWPGSSTPT